MWVDFTFCFQVRFLLGYSTQYGTQIRLKTFLGVALSNSRSNSTLKGQQKVS